MPGDNDFGDAMALAGVRDHVERIERELLPSDEIKRRIREKAELLAELNAKVQKAPMPDPLGDGAPVGIEYTVAGLSPKQPITADGRKLAGLMSKAKKLEAAAHALHERANAAGQAAYTARLELNNYMSSNGLA